MVLLNSADGGSRISGTIEETKSPSPFGASTSIASAKQRLADGGESGSLIFTPIAVETSVPPTYVAARVKAHENGGKCVVFRP